MLWAARTAGLQLQLTSFCRAFSSLSCKEYCLTSNFSRLASIFFSHDVQSCLSLTTEENLKKGNKLQLFY